MDVRRSARLIVGACFLGLFFLGCSQTKTTENTFSKASKSCEGSVIKGEYIVMWENGNITKEYAEDDSDFIKNFLEPQLNQIHKAEPNRKILLPSDVGSQAPHNSFNSAVSTMASATWGPLKVMADQVWSQNIRGQGVRVAVIDTGIDYSHPQIQPQLDINQAELNGLPGVDDDHNGFVDDTYGWDFFGNQPAPEINSNIYHGSHVAGIILASHNTGPVRGMAPDAKLIPINFMDTTGAGDIGTAIQSIGYAVIRGAKIINASWGGDQCNAEVVSLSETIAGLAGLGILFVAASGNEARDLDQSPTYPAVFTSAAQLTVAASSVSDFLAGFSNTSFQYVHLGAPGVDIYSTVPGGYAALDGTSMATPFVSGAAALLWSAKPNATLQQIRNALLNSVDVRSYRVMTRGRLNVKKALDELRRTVP